MSRTLKLLIRNGEPLLHISSCGIGEATINVGHIEDGEELEFKFDNDSSIGVIFSNTEFIDGKPIISYLKSLHEICCEVIESAASNGFV